MGYTYKDNEKVALEIIKRLKGKVLQKTQSMNYSCGVIFTTFYSPFDIKYKVGDFVEGLIREINPNCKLDVKWSKCSAYPKSGLSSSEGAAYAVRDTYYDDNSEEEYCGTEIYIAACGTPTDRVYVITVCLEGE